MNKKTKIVCTIGPASWDPEVMRKMIEGGMNVARVNGAFADAAELDKVKALVEAVSKDVSLMLDVKGPEVRLNKFPEPLKLTPGMHIDIGSTKDAELNPANYLQLYKFVKPGQRILVGDGDVELLVTDVKKGVMSCKVIFGVVLKPGKALSLPGCEYSTVVLTAKDKENLRHAMATGWDFVSPSFIQDKNSAMQIKKFIAGSDMQIIAKIEDQKGLDNIDEILPIVDGIMVARGGLGIQLGLVKVPMAQKLLIEKANNAGKPVITATQMLESMTMNPSPTRAEANDAAMAVLEGTDALMLSAETTTGKYPVEAVRFLSSTAAEIEKFIEPKVLMTRALDAGISTDALTKAAATLCIDSENEIKKVVIVSRSGKGARLLVRHNISQPVYAFVSSTGRARTLLLSKGIMGTYVQKRTTLDRDNAVKKILLRIKKLGIAAEGEKILLICKTTFEGLSYFPNVFEVITV